MEDNILPLHSVTNNRKSLKLAQQFSKIIGSGIPFVTPVDLEKINAETSEFADWLITKRSGDLSESVWGKVLISNMLEKGYNPSALASTFTSAKYCLNEFKSSVGSTGSVFAIELGTGAGWSTVILYNLLRNSYKDFVITAIDVSPYAISSTAKMLDYFAIPYQIRIGKDKVIYSSNPSGATAIVLQWGDFLSTISQVDEQTVNGVWSNHGTAYLTNNDHIDLLSSIHKSLSSKGFFLSDSLAPSVAINLDKFFVISSVLLGNNRRRFQRIPFERKYHFTSLADGNRALKKMFDEESAAFLDWMHYLLFSGHIIEFRKYLAALKRSVNSQQIIREWVKTSSGAILKNNIYSNSDKWQHVELPVSIQGPYTQTIVFKK